LRQPAATGTSKTGCTESSTSPFGRMIAEFEWGMPPRTCLLCGAWPRVHWSRKRACRSARKTSAFGRDGTTTTLRRSFDGFDAIAVADCVRAGLGMGRVPAEGPMRRNYPPDSFEFSPEKSLGRSSRTPMRGLFEDSIAGFGEIHEGVRDDVLEIRDFSGHRSKYTEKCPVAMRRNKWASITPNSPKKSFRLGEERAMTPGRERITMEQHHG
jgi:hypothetical protein